MGADKAHSRSLAEQWAILLLGMGLFLGALVRLYPVWNAHFPINDGGMFYAAIEDIRNNHWLLPAFLTYNRLNIPFAYPPIGFYLVGGLGSLGGLSTLAGVQWIPALISVLTIGVVYFIGQALFRSPIKAGLAALIFAFLPRGFGWIILGGGVTRAPGLLFFLLTVLNAYHLFFDRNTRRIWAVGVFGSLVILSHPDAALHTAVVCALLWVCAPQKGHNIKLAGAVVLMILVLTSPWWLTVLSRHGLEPFRSALQVGGSGGSGLLMLLLSNFAEEVFLPVFTVCALLGVLALFYRKEYLLIFWFVLPFIVHPRSAATYATIPLAFLASASLNDVIIPGLATIRRNRGETKPPTDDDWQTDILPVARVVVGILVIYGFASAFFFGSRLSQYYTLPEAQRQAMTWAKGATTADARFLILTGEPNWSQDPIQEWFPVLAERQSVTTIQGQEWLLGSSFNPLAEVVAHLETDCPASDNVACLTQWREDTGLDFDYVYLGMTNPGALPLAAAMSNSPAFTLAYSGSDVLIYQFVESP